MGLAVIGAEERAGEVGSNRAAVAAGWGRTSWLIARAQGKGWGGRLQLRSGRSREGPMSWLVSVLREGLGKSRPSPYICVVHSSERPSPPEGVEGGNYRN